MRTKRLRIGVRGLMTLVAVAAGLLGWRHFEALRVEYEEEAINCGLLQEAAWLNANITHEEWLKRCREIDSINTEHPVVSGSYYWLMQPDPPELEQRRVEYWGQRKAKYERAARQPWLTVEPDEAEPR